MDKAYRVVYTNKSGEKLAGMWKDMVDAKSELQELHLGLNNTTNVSVHNPLDLTVDLLHNVTHAEIEEM